MTDKKLLALVRDFSAAIIARGEWRGCTYDISDRMRYDGCADCRHGGACALRAQYNELIENVGVTRDAMRAAQGYDI